MAGRYFVGYWLQNARVRYISIFVKDFVDALHLEMNLAGMSAQWQIEKLAEMLGVEIAWNDLYRAVEAFHLGCPADEAKAAFVRGKQAMNVFFRREFNAFTEFAEKKQIIFNEFAF